jgi:hypothetical protein
MIKVERKREKKETFTDPSHNLGNGNTDSFQTDLYRS